MWGRVLGNTAGTRPGACLTLVSCKTDLGELDPSGYLVEGPLVTEGFL